MNTLLTNKTALIFGAKGALGKNVAKVFNDFGATTYLSDLSVEGVKEQSSEGEIRKLDTLDEVAVKQYFEWFVKENIAIDIIY